MTPLTATEAQALTERAQHAADTLAHLLTVLHDGEAWRALEYPSWKAYVDANFDVSLRTIYRMMRRDKARTALAGSDIVSRFTEGALDVLADNDSFAYIETIAKIAANSTTGQVGMQTVKAVKGAVLDMIYTKAVDIDGEQYAVKDALALSVQAAERETFLRESGRTYLAANVEVTVDTYDFETVTFKVNERWSHELMRVFDGKMPVHISIWRDAK